MNWRRPVYELDTAVENNGFVNEDFIVWMRTAALPTFRKLYRIINKSSNMVPTLPRGNYTLDVVYSILGVGRSRGLDTESTASGCRLKRGAALFMLAC